MNILILSFFIGCLAAAEYSVESTTCPNIIHAERAFSRRGAKRDTSPERIIGGEITPIEEAPYMAAILEYDFFLCGASILSTVFVITAAHCIAGVLDISSLSVRIGSSRTKRGGQERSVIYWSTHPDFDERYYSYDCAVLRVNEAFNKTATVYQELKLPYYETRVGEKLVASGWGYSGKQRKRAFLKSVNISVLERQICVDYYKKSKYRMPISAFCGGNLEGGRDTCTGDSGGPAVRNHAEIVGVISFGFSLPCGKPRVPGVYTDIYFIVDWVYTAIHNPLWQED